MLIIDAHLDLSWNALQWNRDLTRSVYTIRTQENTTAGKGRGLGTVAFPEMRQGRVALCFATLLARSTGQPVPHIDFATPAQSYEIAHGQLAYYRALEHYGGPVLASHNNCRALVPHQRQFSDDQIRAIVERGGVIGAALDAWMLKPGWVIGERYNPTNPTVTLRDVVDHIDHICQLVGNSHHAALGTDLDGGFGREQAPQDLDTIADLQKLVGLLTGRGYAEPDIDAIMHGNWLRLLRRALGE